MGSFVCSLMERKASCLCTPSDCLGVEASTSTRTCKLTSTGLASSSQVCDITLKSSRSRMNASLFPCRAILGLLGEYFFLISHASYVFYMGSFIM